MDKAKILVVDDDVINREIISEFLRIKNANIKFTESGEEALDIYINSSEYHFDAIIIDFRLPNLNGLKVSEMIRESKRIDAKEVSIILMSANKLEEIDYNVNKSIFNDFIYKPININKLYTIISSNVLKK